jgi:hypothetical protein
LLFVRSATGDTGLLRQGLRVYSCSSLRRNCWVSTQPTGLVLGWLGSSRAAALPPAHPVSAEPRPGACPPGRDPSRPSCSLRFRRSLWGGSARRNRPDSVWSGRDRRRVIELGGLRCADSPYEDGKTGPGIAGFGDMPGIAERCYARPTGSAVICSSLEIRNTSERNHPIAPRNKANCHSVRLDCAGCDDHSLQDVPEQTQLPNWQARRLDLGQPTAVHTRVSPGKGGHAPGPRGCPWGLWARSRAGSQSPLFLARARSEREPL